MEGLQGRSLAIFEDFTGAQGGPKITKNRKMAFPKSIEKKNAKKEAMTPVGGEGRRPSRSPRNPRFRSGRLLQRLIRCLKHASTPGGVRRIYLATPVSADPPDSSYAADKPVPRGPNRVNREQTNREQGTECGGDQTSE